MRKLLIFTMMLVLFACVKQQTHVDNGDQNAQDRLNAPLEHTILYSGENLALIARWYTGDSANWKVIAAENPAIVPNKMRLGDRVMIPARILKTRDPLPKDYVWKGQKARTTTLVEGVDAAASSSSASIGEASSSSAPAAIIEEVTITPSSEMAPTGQQSSVALEPVSPSLGQTSSAALEQPLKVQAPTTTPTEEDLNKAKLLDELLE